MLVDKQEDGEVQVMYSTYDSGTVTGVSTAACPLNKLSNHPGEAYQYTKSSEKAP